MEGVELKTDNNSICCILSPFPCPNLPLPPFNHMYEGWYGTFMSHQALHKTTAIYSIVAAQPLVPKSCPLPIPLVKERQNQPLPNKAVGQSSSQAAE